MANIIIGDQETRIIKLDAKQPDENDRLITHKVSIEVEVMDRDEWQAMAARWSTLGELMQQRKMAVENGTEMPEASPADIEESRRPIYKYAIPYIKNIEGPFVDPAGKPVPFDTLIEAIQRHIPWMHEPIEAAFMAAQQGITATKYRENRAKNS